ncbi:DNA-3-methyladenine glycosylase 2 family protein [Alkalicella caledoniensis]|uniref:DNA-3-methyladenine glycosylase II n=1 Tax=Alkalicella caledoniensis TaxID=2731377 RepID=A0A7G9W9Y5_ALKCA|nr:DNA-3-methyladenine glycosylase 2 family protein [Alkalicella caledoniensis]QNO15497.1 DNA-3-methyladenine glycosylase 2 family protein [Alkalicella caledoniensis]
MNEQYFIYSDKEIEYLKKKDKKLGLAIERIGLIKRKINPDVFASLIESIVGQQISTKAAETVNSRLLAIAGKLTPEEISKLELDQIQKCGMSLRKAGYIKGIADAAINGAVEFDKLHMLENNEIIRKLSSLNGVGEWTAEMLLIFSLQRPDVVSYKDLAIRRGIMKLYGLKELSKDKFVRYKKRYSPWGSVASLYLWAISAQ